MKPIEIIEKIQQRKPEALKNVPPKKAAAVARATLGEVAIAVRQLHEGVLRVPGFGVFTVKEVERNVDGVKKIVKRILFRPIAEREERPK